MEQKKLGFGLMRLPLKDSRDQTSVDMEQLKKMVDAFLENGFTYFDTAYMYHDGVSETAIGEALAPRHPRDSFTLATKMPLMIIRTEADQERIFKEQLVKCKVDHFDYYMAHNVCNLFYPIAQKLKTFEFMQRMKDEGKIRKIGFSFHDDAELLEKVLNDHPEVDFVQLQINYVDWDSAAIQSHKCYDIAVKHGKEVIVMEPVKGGMLAKVPADVSKIFREYEPGLSDVSWAIRFAASHDGVGIVLSGMSEIDQLMDNMSYMKDFEPMNDKEKDVALRAASIINGTIAIPCTNCRYCVKSCPRDVAIPEYFSLYNTDVLANPAGFSIQSAYYLNLTKVHGKASDCIACGNCENECPQHIKIIDMLKDVVERFESNPPF